MTNERWIPVTESLPPCGVYVLAWRPKTNHYAKGPIRICLVERKRVKGVECANNQGVGFVWEEFGAMQYWGWEMTHWMPLPTTKPTA